MLQGPNSLISINLEENWCHYLALRLKLDSLWMARTEGTGVGMEICSPEGQEGVRLQGKACPPQYKRRWTRLGVGGHRAQKQRE